MHDLSQMMGEGKQHLVCIVKVPVWPRCVSSVSGCTDSSKAKLSDLFSLMLTEANQKWIEDFYFDLTSNELHCHASNNCLHTYAEEEGEETHQVKASLSHLEEILDNFTTKTTSSFFFSHCSLY